MSLPGRRRGAVAISGPFLIVTAILLGACDPDNDTSLASATDYTMTDSVAGADTSQFSARFDTTTSTASNETSEDPFASFGYGQAKDVDATIIHRIAARIVNLTSEEAIVLADAGAGAVLVDTVSVGDSLLVNLETRGDSILVTGLSPAGVSVGSSWISTDSAGARVVFP